MVDFLKFFDFLLLLILVLLRTFLFCLRISIFAEYLNKNNKFFYNNEGYNNLTKTFNELLIKLANYIKTLIFYSNLVLSQFIITLNYEILFKFHI